MKQFIIPGLLAILLAACNNENGGSKGSKSEAEKKVSKRDYSITKANAYSDLFLDSTAMEKYITTKKTR